MQRSEASPARAAPTVCVLSLPDNPPPSLATPPLLSVVCVPWQPHPPPPTLTGRHLSRPSAVCQQGFLNELLYWFGSGASDISSGSRIAAALRYRGSSSSACNVRRPPCMGEQTSKGCPFRPHASRILHVQAAFPAMVQVPALLCKQQLCPRLGPQLCERAPCTAHGRRPITARQKSPRPQSSCSSSAYQ